MLYPSTRLRLYAQVEDALAGRISGGALLVGTQLPSEEQLIREFDVNRGGWRVHDERRRGGGGVVFRRVPNQSSHRSVVGREPWLVHEVISRTNMAYDDQGQQLMRPNPLRDIVTFRTRPDTLTIAFWILLLGGLGIAITVRRSDPGQRAARNIGIWGDAPSCLV
jgi:hypothetical protein